MFLSKFTAVTICNRFIDSTGKTSMTVNPQYFSQCPFYEEFRKCSFVLFARSKFANVELSSLSYQCKQRYLTNMNGSWHCYYVQSTCQGFCLGSQKFNWLINHNQYLIILSILSMPFISDQINQPTQRNSQGVSILANIRYILLIIFKLWNNSLCWCTCIILVMLVGVSLLCMSEVNTHAHACNWC